VIDSHIPDDRLDEYAVVRLDEPAAAEIEEHLLVCEYCRERLALIDQIIRAVRAAAHSN
jgi:anti-sigma factor RsiW